MFDQDDIDGLLSGLPDDQFPIDESEHKEESDVTDSSSKKVEQNTTTWINKPVRNKIRVDYICDDGSTGTITYVTCYNNEYAKSVIGKDFQKLYKTLRKEPATDFTIVLL